MADSTSDSGSEYETEEEEVDSESNCSIQADWWTLHHVKNVYSQLLILNITTLDGVW